MVFLGAPGAGKGTQARLISESQGIPQISTGDILRAAVREGTPLGREAQGYMERGELVPDAVMVGLIRERLSGPDCANGFILDGFPRTLEQAAALDALLGELQKPLTHVFDVEVPREELLKRLTGRRVCRSCSASFHAVFNPPRVEGICDHCGGELVQRADDNAQTVGKRLDVYGEQTRPLTAYYREKGLLRTIDGERPIAEIQREFADLLGAGRTVQG
jgi:adenylate kinase